MASVLSSPTPSLPSESKAILTPPLLDSPSVLDPDAAPPALDPSSSSSQSSSSSAANDSQPSTPTSTHSAHSNVVPAYPYNVAMAPSSFGGGPVPDDSEITTRLPSICVDYLSHDWAEDDVWTSWKAMTRHKSEIANGVRLENASWRTWAKQRGKLKTISPETLNWLKDSDVTWLYGPLHTAVEAVPPPKVASANDRLGLEPLRPLNKLEGTPKKAASLPVSSPEKLKNAVTKKETPSGQPASPNLEQLGHDLEDQATISVHHARSDSHLVRLNSLNRKKRSSPAHSPAGSSPERNASDSSSSASYFFQQATKKKERRHISFNHRVEQCIAIDSSDEIARPYGSTTSSSSSSDDDDDVLTFGSSPRHPQLPPKGNKEPHTIARLGPTTLKSVEVYPAPSPAVVYQNVLEDEVEELPVAHDQVEAPKPVSTAESRSGGGGAGAASGAGLLPASGAPNASGSSDSGGAASGTSEQQAAGQQAMFDYSSRGGPSRSQWDPEDEDDYAMGFDYFTGGGGPDIAIGDEYDMASYAPAHLIGGTHNGYQGGSVNQPSNYLGGGPYSPNPPYAPGSGALDPSLNAPTIPHYRDSSSDSSRGPYSPSLTREAPSPKRSAMKGSRTREPSADSDVSIQSQSPSSPSLASSTTPTSAVATAIPSHVRPSSVRRTSSEERPPTAERGRSASRGSSSSLERATSADRRTSTSISPSSSYSPPSNAGPTSAAKPISIQPSQRLGSYESLGAVGSAMGAGGTASTGAGRMPDVPEVSPQSEAPSGFEQPAKKPLNIITSSSVDSFSSFGMPTTPTSPGIMMSSPQNQRYQTFNVDEEEDDNAQVEDVEEAKSFNKAQRSASATPAASSSAAASVPALPKSNSSSSLDAPSQHAGHGRTPSGPRLRNPSPSNPTTSTTTEEGHGHPSSSTEAIVSPAQTERVSSRDLFDSSKPDSVVTDESSSTGERKPSFARRSLLRAARASSEQGREQSPPALARSASEGANTPSRASTNTTGADGEYAFGYDGDAGKGIDVAGTARDLLGAISKGIWGSLGRSSR
ncbi:GATA-like domain-containing protein [Sporobolomyces koalae]|uniref:GATA-like domain-containing protein n=1 Tax=Sporobolomyces koalae TaxID=500713 RepID=UPI0031801033